MRIGTLRRARPVDAAPGVVTGTARLDRRTKELTRRLQPGDVAVLDHVDLAEILAMTPKAVRDARERALLLDGVGVPDVRTALEGRHALVVVRGYDHKEDLAALRPYIRDHRPVLIGVDGGADALIEAGYTPDMVIGDMDSVSDGALTCGAEVVVHAYPDGRAPGLARVQELGVPAITFPAAATSEDVAILLADDKGARLIVAVGTHATLVEFLDKGRGGMASTFLTRLRLGGKLVDAKGVSRLYLNRVPTAAVVGLVLAALLAVVAVLAVSAVGGAYLGLVVEQWHGFLVRLEDLVP